MFDRIVIPMGCLIISTITAGIALYWLVIVKSELARLHLRLSKDAEEFEKSNEALERQVRELANRIEQAENRTHILTSQPPKSGFNLAKRSQALRLSSRGGNPEDIASTLHVPKKEIELLLKIQRLTKESSATS